MTIRAVQYGRMSSDAQEGSLEQQRDALAPIAQREGLQVVRVFEDSGISGVGESHRDGLQQMLAYCDSEAKRGEPVQALLCWDTARLSRSQVMDAATTYARLMKARVFTVVTSERKFDLRSEQDRAGLLLLQDFQNYGNAKKIASQGDRGRKDAFAAGFHSNGPPPFGFCRGVWIDGQITQVLRRDESLDFRRRGSRIVLVIDEEEAAVVRRIYAELLEGRPLRRIAEGLNADGIAAPGSARGRSAPWSRSTVRSILANPKMVGDSFRWAHKTGKFYRGGQAGYYDGQPVERRCTPEIKHDVHQGIVDRATWTLAQERLAAVGPLGRGAAKGKAAYVMAGLLRCACCGSSLFGMTSSQKISGQQYLCRRYCCSSRRNSGAGSCEAYSIGESTVVGPVLATVLARYLSPARLEALRQAMDDQAKGTADVPAQRRRLERQIADADTGIARMTKRLSVVDDAIFDEVAAELARLKKERNRLASELAAVVADRASEADAAARAADALSKLDKLRGLVADAAGLARTLRSLTVQAREALREVVRQLVSGIQCHFTTTQRPDGKKKHDLTRLVVRVKPLLGDCVPSGGSYWRFTPPADAGGSLKRTRFAFDAPTPAK